MFTLFFRYPRQLQQVPEKSGLQGLVAVNGHGQAHDITGLAVDVVTAVDAPQVPAVPLQ